MSRINESTEKNAFLKVRLNLKAMGLSDESEWKVKGCEQLHGMSKIFQHICIYLVICILQEKLKEEESLRHQLEEALLQLQLKMKSYNTEL